MTRPLVLLALVLALAGCAVPTASAPPAETGVEVGVQGVIAAPVAVAIPAIGAESTLEPLGLNPDGTLAVPPITEPGQASWYEDGDAGVIPGQDGPALIAGHRSGRDASGASVPGVFARLDELAPGDAVLTTDSTGWTLHWRVERIAVYPKDALDWAEVVGDTDGPALRLITCEGALRSNEQGGLTYSDNLVVYAVPA